MSKKGKIMAKNNWDEELDNVGNDLQRLKENARQRPKIILGVIFAVVSSVILIVTGAEPIGARSVFAPILAGIFFGVTVACAEETSESDCSAITTVVVFVSLVGNFGILIHTAIGWGYTTFGNAMGVGMIELLMLIMGAPIGAGISGGVMKWIFHNK